MPPSVADTAIRSERVVTPAGVQPATILIGDGRILGVVSADARVKATQREDMGRLVVSPGFVDVHVHCNEPGRTEWEGFEHATRAAAAGGITTIVDMPLNSVPPTTDAAALQAKREAAAGQLLVDVGFWAGVVPGSVTALPELLLAGAFGAKCFLTDSGVEEFPPLSYRELCEALEVLAVHERPLLVHAEDDHLLERTPFSGRAEEYAAWTASRPAAAEARAIEQVAAAVRDVGGDAHIVHLSSAAGLAALARAQREGLHLSAETCPHYLALAAEELPGGSVAAKCAPPIRTSQDREALWAALGSGTLPMIASDHSPCPTALKRPDLGDLRSAWGGVSSLQIAPRVAWTHAVSRGHSVTDLARWTAANPAAFAGLDRKGRIAPGCDADLVIWDPDARVTVAPEQLESRHPHTPYAGHELLGRVHASYVRGHPVWQADELTAERPGATISAPKRNRS